jgi:hypothetical protein
MKSRTLSLTLIPVLLVALFLPAGGAMARDGDPPLPIAVDIDSRLKDRPAPAQLSSEEAEAVVAASPTTSGQCFESTEALTVTITSFDPANPGSQDVVFWNESDPAHTGSATLWVAWDFLTTDYGREDVIDCDMLAYLQGQMDSIVDTDVEYFGDYVQRPDGNENIDVMVYNIVDESYFDPEYPFYIAGFFWASVNLEFDRNMIFIDSLDWANRLGPNDSPWRGDDPSLWRPNLYEGTVAHELEHLIHFDHDADEESWIDEGMADLAEYLNGFGHPDSHVVYFLAYHRTPLTLWGSALEDYGASYLFQLYMLENFGTKTGGTWNPGWTRTLIDEQANSIAGVEAATGADFNDLFDAWMVANYLDDPGQDGAGGFPIGYHEINLTPYVSDSYSPWSIERSIADIYGADHHGNLPVSRYYGGYISGTVEYPLGEVPPYTGVYGLYKGMPPVMNISLRGDGQSGVAPNTDMYEAASGGGQLLTDRMLALNTSVGGTLTFWTWFDIEEEWDYGFVEASTDGGSTWEPLPGSITRTSSNPNDSTAWANSLVGGEASTDTAITGNSGGWVEATFELPAASGVLVRFSYYTDEAVNGQGWFIDDVSVDGFSDGFESGSGSWDLGGWSVTTGLFDNDWIAGYVNPVYNRGKRADVEWGSVDDVASGNFLYVLASVDTSRLNRESATVFFANRPGEAPFSAAYLLLVDKGKASK